MLPFLTCKWMSRSALERCCDDNVGSSCEVPHLVKSQMKDMMAVQSIMKSLKIKIATRHVQICMWESELLLNSIFILITCTSCYSCRSVLHFIPKQGFAPVLGLLHQDFCYTVIDSSHIPATPPSTLICIPHPVPRHALFMYLHSWSSHLLSFFFKWHQVVLQSAAPLQKRWI